MQPYKGVRDFYPEDQRVQRHIFTTMRDVVERFGYEEINASVLEPTELYLAKTSEEIVNDESYTFEDRGGRSVTLRPEMTPTVARMVANRKRELPYPLRWYSLPNLFRYQRPQHGRLREHWQLNADIFGVDGDEADIEIVTIAHTLLREFGASNDDFEIRVSDRRFLDALYDSLSISVSIRKDVTRLLDKKDKQDITTQLAELLDSDEVAKALLSRLDNPDIFPSLQTFVETLRTRGIANAVVDTGITRGFDYYTGVVFEVYDTNRKNTRSIFGGGRYDNLVQQYGNEPVPACGFGMGDVTTRDFLETHDLLPTLPSSAMLYIAPATHNNTESMHSAVTKLREHGLNVAVGMKHTKIADHIKAASKLAIPFFAVWGENEETSQTLTVKNLITGEENTSSVESVADSLR